jgi:hypothetical protein
MKSFPWTLTGKVKLSRGLCGWPIWHVQEMREISRRQNNGGHQPHIVTVKTRWRLATYEDLMATPLKTNQPNVSPGNG